MSQKGDIDYKLILPQNRKLIKIVTNTIENKWLLRRIQKWEWKFHEEKNNNV